MGDYRSKSYVDGRMQMESHYESRPYVGGRMQMESHYESRPYFNPYYFRSYNVSYASYPPPPPAQMGGRVRVFKVKKGKSTGASSSKSWSFNDPEFQRRKRVASYKVYPVEGKVNGSLRKSFRWLKDRYTQVVNGWW